jgi:hypothetical protein
VHSPGPIGQEPPHRGPRPMGIMRKSGYYPKAADLYQVRSRVMDRGYADFVDFHALYGRVGGVRNLSTRLVGFLLGSAHGFFALPQGYGDGLTALAVR